MSAFRTLIGRDLRLAVRVGGEAMTLVLFFVMVAVIVPFAIGPDRPLGAGGTSGARRTGWPLRSSRTLRTSRALGAGSSLWTSWPSVALRALEALASPKVIERNLSFSACGEAAFADFYVAIAGLNAKTITGQGTAGGS